MRSIFPAHFRPTPAELESLWGKATFAIDANVLLNLYRYSPAARQELEQGLDGVRDRLFLPHQGAQEFLRNRLKVTSDQAKEYTSAETSLKIVLEKLENRKRHPFVSDSALAAFSSQVATLISELNEKRNELLERLITDERLEVIEQLFNNKTGKPFNDDQLKEIAEEGAIRYDKKIPPGYKDENKSSDLDPNRKFGDLILWKQLIEEAQTNRKPVILISDDGKEDWWLEHAGRTIGPRTELREEFINATKCEFWMYGVDAFLEQSARRRNETVSQEIIEEIVEVSTESRARRAANQERSNRSPFYRITEEEMVEKLRSGERWAAEHEGFIGLYSFVQNHLGNSGFDYATSYSVLEDLERKGVVELYEHQGEGFSRPTRAVRLLQRDHIPIIPMTERLEANQSRIQDANAGTRNQDQ